VFDFFKDCSVDFKTALQGYAFLFFALKLPNRWMYKAKILELHASCGYEN